MIHSSLYSFGEPSVWDPKVIREHLCIPEDQLKILSNVPGWSKDKDSSNVSRIEKDTIIENSQSSQKEISFTTIQRNRKEQNIKAFVEHFQNHKSFLLSIDIYRKKIARSVSLFDIDKVSENVSDDKSLKRVLSAPLLSESLYNSCTTSFRKGSKSVEFSEEKSNENCFIVEQKKNYPPKEDMEIIPTLPVNVNLVEKDRKIEVLEKNMLSTIQTRDDSVSLSSTSFPAVASNVPVNNGLPILPEKECQLTEPLVESESNKNATTGIVKDLLYEDKPRVSENNKMNGTDQISTKISEIASEISESAQFVQKEQINVEILVANNEGNSILQNACKEVLECDKEPCVISGDIVVNTLILEKAVAETESHEDNAVVKIAAIPETVSKKESYKKSHSEVMECDKEPHVQSGDTIINTASLEKAVSETEPQLCEKNDNIVCNIAAAEKAIIEKESDKKFDNVVAYFAAAAEKVNVTSSDVEKIVEKKSQEIAGEVVKTVPEKVVAEKRKLQCKEKVNKKRKTNTEKQVQCGPRNIKRAGEIYYSVNNFTSMINILKRFF